MKTPGPDHPLVFTASPAGVRVRLGGHVIAASDGAVTLREADYPAVQYFPRDDVETGFLSATDKAYTCPYKGACTFYSVLLDGELHENVAWSYEEPYPAAQPIRGHIAFYPNRADIYTASEADASR